MNLLIIFLFIFYIIYLFFESYQNRMNRNSLTHVIHVNGTRGKSSTSRLIDAALRGGDYKIFCKTTGTSARTIDTNGVEKPIIRKGRANIREQIKIIKEASKQNADILIIECMAVKPELQYISQHKILNADISIVTNARRDHLEEMGPTLNDVAISLGNVMPKNGVFITSEDRFIDYYRELGLKNNSEVLLAESIEDNHKIDINENVCIALAVCEVLGVDKEVAIQRMKDYYKDPGVLKIYKIYTHNNMNIKFINGLAINDPDSISLIYEKLNKEGLFDENEFILLVNNRGDRVYRMKQHVELIKQLKPNQIWITGEFKWLMKRNLLRSNLPRDSIFIIDLPQLIKIHSLQQDSIIFAIGNMVGHGEKIIEYIEEIGDAIV